MSAKVLIQNLSYYTTESQLADLLAEAGQVVDVYLPADRQGTAVVEFANLADALGAIERFRGHDVDGRGLFLELYDS